MFLECKRTNVTVPRSSDITLIFPFDQLFYRFKRQAYNPLTLDTKRYAIEKINDVIDQIETKCDNFRRVKKFRNLAIFSTIIFALGIILGNVLLNIGIDQSSHSNIEFVKFQANQYMIGGGILLVGNLLTTTKGFNTMLLPSKTRSDNYA